MTHKWQLQEAKNRFSEVVSEALVHGPQLVTRHGEEAVIVLSVKDYKKLAKPEVGLADFFRRSPLAGVPMDLERSKELPRDIDL